MNDDDSTPVRGQTIVVTTVTYRDRVLLDLITKGIFGAFPGGVERSSISPVGST